MTHPTDWYRLCIVYSITLFGLPYSPYEHNRLIGITQFFRFVWFFTGFRIRILFLLPYYIDVLRNQSSRPLPILSYGFLVYFCSFVFYIFLSGHSIGLLRTIRHWLLCRGFLIDCLECIPNRSLLSILRYWLPAGRLNWAGQGLDRE